MNDPTWISADHGPASNLSPPNRRERMHSPQNTHIKEEDGKKDLTGICPCVSTDDSSSESGSGNGMHTMTPPSAGGAAPGSERCMGGTPYRKVVNGNRPSAPLDFSTTSSSSSSEDQQAPVNLSETRLPGSALMGPFQLDPPDELRRKYPVKPLTHASELRLDRDSIRDYGNKSPQYSSGSYDSLKMETCAEDLTVTRGVAAADDDDDDDHDDSDKINDTEGMDPERLKAFNMFVRLFVDENLDRMVPISKQPKEKIQAIIESCSRQFPEFELRARKRIRTYLKSCRRMKKNGMETRPTPPHLTSAMAENILAAACESETRKAAKRMRLDVYQAHVSALGTELSPLDKPSSREPASLAHSAYSLAASAYSQDQLYINGGLNYSYRGYGGLGASMQHPVSLTTATAQSNGPTDLSMKSLVSNSSSASSNSHGRSGGGGGSGASAQLSPTEITAVRQLIAGYRESAAFLLRSADELETLILQQN
uniref:Nucleolar protein 4 helical domain-containing protein n=1 Tax=Oncorhynchus tshawytscha TaxID=74940 RepID=A0A8C8JH97_ONCTS